MINSGETLIVAGCILYAIGQYYEGGTGVKAFALVFIGVANGLIFWK